MSAADQPTDQAMWGIIASNVFAMIVALALRWDVRELLWPYFIQSVVIGFYARRRMLALRDFSTEGFPSGDVPLQPTVETQKSTANFFTLHYGFFHSVYLVFLYQGSMNAEQPLTQLDGLMYVVVGLAFLLTHGRSHREHVEADLASRPNLGALMFMPYLRVIPMHLVILFSVLKTLVDVGMHKFEHRRLQKGREATE